MCEEMSEPRHSKHLPTIVLSSLAHNNNINDHEIKNITGYTETLSLFFCRKERISTNDNNNKWSPNNDDEYD